jgi:hypothetical protein
MADETFPTSDGVVDWTTTGSRSGRKVVTALFRNRSSAEAAAAALEDAGVPKGAVRFMPGYERDTTDDGTVAGDFTVDPLERNGFWASLGDLFLPDDDRDLYAHGMSRGGFLLSVDVDASNHDRVVDILDREGTIDTDELEDNWRGQTPGVARATGAPRPSIPRTDVGIAHSSNSGASSATELSRLDDPGRTNQDGGDSDALNRSLPARDASSTSRWSAADSTANGSFTRQAFGDEGEASGSRAARLTRAAGTARVRSYMG